ncbi:MAG: VOC family protein [Candidatus Binatia bacterium]
MIETVGIYHVGIPVDDLDRAVGFYTTVLSMKVVTRIGAAGEMLVRLKCGDSDVVLFQRPHPLKRNSLHEDGISHQAFEVSTDSFGPAVEILRRKGYLHGEPVVRASGRAVYFFDSEGNYQQLHASS